MPQQDAISNRGPDLPSNGVDRFPFFRSQLELGGSNIVFQMRERRRPGDGQHDGRSSQKPGQRNLVNTHAVGLCREVQWVLRFQTAASPDGKPWQKAKILLLAINQNVFRFAVLDVVPVLHADDRNNLARPHNFFRINVG